MTPAMRRTTPGVMEHEVGVGDASYIPLLGKAPLVRAPMFDPVIVHVM